MPYPSIIPDNVGTNKKKTDANGNVINTSGTGTTTTTANGTATSPTYGQVPLINQNATGTDQLVPLSTDAIKQGNNQVIQTAQEAVTGQQNPNENYLNNQVQQMTTDLLNDPYQGLDVNSYKRNVMDEFNSQLSEAGEAARQKLGDTSQSGELQNEFLRNALYGARQRADLSNQVNYDLSNLRNQRMLDALAAGRAGVETSGNAFSNYINNLATVGNMAEGGLNREATAELQANSQAWQTSERISTEDFTATQNALDRIEERATRENNTALTKWVENKRAETTLRVQTNDMTHDEKMAYLNNELANAYADNDVERQKDILQFQGTITLNEMEKQHGYDVAIENIRGDIEKSIKEGDYANATALQTAELEYRVNHDIQEFALEKAAQELTAKGVNMDIIERQYNQIAEAYGEEAANEFISTTLQEQGVDMSGYQIADKKSAALQAMAEEHEMMIEQFKQTHPQFVDQATGEITPDGLETFNDYFNFTMYGEMSDEMKEERRTAGYLGEDDIEFAQPGDKYLIETGTTAANGMFVPPGEYSVVSEQNTEGQKFWGTQRDVERVYLVNNETGEKYMVDKTKSGTKGNIISGLWAES